MGQRLSLQKILEKTLKRAGNVYFQPPESVKLNYPAIVYSLDYIKSQHGDNISYTNAKRYSVTLITKDPDTGLVDDVLQLPMCSFERSFTADNLNHYVFNLYY